MSVYKLNSAQVDNLIKILDGYQQGLKAQEGKPGASKDVPIWIQKVENFKNLFLTEGKDE